MAHLTRKISSIAGDFCFEPRHASTGELGLQLQARRKADVGAVLQVRALRTVSRHVSHLPRRGHGDGLAARAHLPDAAGRRRPPSARRLLRHPHRSLPWLPQLPDRMSFWRAVWAFAGKHARADRAALPAAVARTQVARRLLRQGPAVICEAVEYGQADSFLPALRAAAPGARYRHLEVAGRDRVGRAVAEN